MYWLVHHYLFCDVIPFRFSPLAAFMYETQLISKRPFFQYIVYALTPVIMVVSWLQSFTTSTTCSDATQNIALESIVVQNNLTRDVTHFIALYSSNREYHEQIKIHVQNQLCKWKYHVEYFFWSLHIVQWVRCNVRRTKKPEFYRLSCVRHVSGWCCKLY